MNRPQLILTKRQRVMLRRILNNGGRVDWVHRPRRVTNDYVVRDIQLNRSTVKDLIQMGFLVEQRQHVVGGLGRNYWLLSENAQWALLRDGALIADGQYRCADA